MSVTAGDIGPVRREIVFEPTPETAPVPEPVIAAATKATPWTLALLDPPPHSGDPRTRALDAVRNRNTGPARDPHRHRGLQ